MYGKKMSSKIVAFLQGMFMIGVACLIPVMFLAALYLIVRVIAVAWKG